MRFPFCKFSRAEGAQKILDFNSVFITSPMDMNDPFEMRPQWTQEHQDHQRDFRNWLNKMSAGMPLLICTTEGLKPGGVMPDLGEEPKLDVEKMWGFADDYNRAVMEFLHQRFRILSLVRHVIDVERDYYNSHSEDLLMWAHYADMFQGVAILLDPYKMNCGIKPWKERPGWPIRYKKERMALFDEIEKAHRLIWDLFLQMLDAASITLADQQAYDLSGFYIVCTSNIGSQQLLRPTRLPFATLERAVLAELHRFFRPELIGRFDEKIVFKPLSPDTQREIGQLAISEELARFRAQGFELTVSEPAVEFLVRRGIHKALGARPMKRTVQKFIGDAIRETLKAGLQARGPLKISTLSDRLVIEG